MELVEDANEGDITGCGEARFFRCGMSSGELNGDGGLITAGCRG
jgi:hypothetical protein